MNAYRILFTSSRGWTDRDAIDGALTTITAVNIFHNRTTVLVHGACPDGGDAMADDWGTWHSARNALIKVERHPADWRPGGKFDRGAGYKRNAAMVALGADVALAFIAPCAQPTCRKPKPHGSHGATHCADAAEAAGIAVRRWTT